MRPDSQRTIDRHAFPVLYVDDEAENLRAFELTFRRDFKVYTATNGKDALALINSEPIAVVLSDHRMPGMMGTELLARVREMAPRVVRLLVTAYGDVATLADAVNNGQIYRYIPKPWIPEEMRVTVQQAIDLYVLEAERESLIADLSALYDVSQDLARHLELKPLVRVLLELVVGRLGFDGATLMLFDENLESLTAADTVPEDGTLATYLRSLRIDRTNGSGLLERMAAGRPDRLVLELANRADPAVRELLTAVSAEEILAIPLVGPMRPLGALIVDNRRGHAGFSPAERALLAGVAAQAAVSIDKACSVDRLRANVICTDRVQDLARLGAMTMAITERLAETCEGEEHALELLAEVRRADQAAHGDEIAIAVVRLDAAVSSVVGAYGAVAEGSGVRVEVGPLKVLKVTTVEAELTAALSLLFGEAIALCSRGGVVEVDLEGVRGGKVEFRAVSDPSRADPERPTGSIRIEGAALLAQRLGGEIQIDDRGDGTCLLRLTLPESAIC